MPLKIQPLLRNDFENDEERFGPVVGNKVESAPYAWASLLHDKLLKVWFTVHDCNRKLVLCDLNAKQLKRAVAQEKKKERAEILVPLDKIGHSDELTVALP